MLYTGLYFLKECLEEARLNPIWRPVGVYDDNLGAITLYKKIGFKFNGEIDTKGEKVMVINLTDMDSKNA